MHEVATATQTGRLLTMAPRDSRNLIAALIVFVAVGAFYLFVP
jgi:hypothetical protein